MSSLFIVFVIHGAFLLLFFLAFIFSCMRKILLTVSAHFDLTSFLSLLEIHIHFFGRIFSSV
jgi:hypothetical protein